MQRAEANWARAQLLIFHSTKATVFLLVLVKTLSLSKRYIFCVWECVRVDCSKAFPSFQMLWFSYDLSQPVPSQTLNLKNHPDWWNSLWNKDKSKAPKRVLCPINLISYSVTSSTTKPIHTWNVVSENRRKHDFFPPSLHFLLLVFCTLPIQECFIWRNAFILNSVNYSKKTKNGKETRNVPSKNSL